MILRDSINIIIWLGGNLNDIAFLTHHITGVPRRSSSPPKTTTSPRGGN